MPRKSLKTDTIVSIPLPGKLNNPLAVTYLMNRLQALKGKDYFFKFSFIPGCDSIHISSTLQQYNKLNNIVML